MTLPGSILPLKLVDLTYAVDGQKLVHNLSLEFIQGPKTLILGPNGAGKSLTLRMAHGLLKPTSGKVQWQQRHPQRHQAMVFQRPVMLRRSAAANIDYALNLKGLGKAEAAELRNEVLAKTGLSGIAARPARVLSIGEQQRLAIARAWALRPQVLFLDEPTASLDPKATRAIEDLIETIHAAGTKIIMSTHDMGQAKRLADEVIFLNQGMLSERTAASDFFSSPRSAEGRAFLEGELLL
ncbi:ATP-binding cassette domain-containing protein [Kiloniella laminariae]|uniref:ATP-binding cassette domain-containing protein n=1 Tax=Kiloniella laminariae TaxID=454162 RepID=UPI00035F5AE5|nr:ATP-binding cassette domain-containing protein [Kiloniella laminariae]